MSLAGDSYERRYPGRVHLMLDGRLYGSRGHRIFTSVDDGATWQLLLELPLDLATRARSATRLSRRLTRSAVHHIARLAGQVLVIFGFDRIFAYDLDDPARPPAVTFVNGRRPLTLCNSGSALYYGEYGSNPERRPMRVFASDGAGTGWRPVHTFDGVRHVHGVHFDPYERAIWMTTGDEEGECGLWRTDDGFRTVSRVLGNGQQQRAVELLFTRDHVYFGTDAPDEVNHICRWARRTGEVETLAAVEGPVFYGCAVGSRLFFGTVCEPSRVNTDRHAVLWGSDAAGEQWAPQLRLRKDPWPMKLFQYGQIQFPAGANSGPYLWLTPQGTAHDQVSLAFRVA